MAGTAGRLFKGIVGFELLAVAGAYGLFHRSSLSCLLTHCAPAYSTFARADCDCTGGGVVNTHWQPQLIAELPRTLLRVGAVRCGRVLSDRRQYQPGCGGACPETRRCFPLRAEARLSSWTTPAGGRDAAE